MEQRSSLIMYLTGNRSTRCRIRTARRFRAMKPAMGVLLLYCLSFGVCGAKADEDCSSPKVRAAVEHLINKSRDMEVLGARDALLEWPMIASLPKDVRARAGER